MKCSCISNECRVSKCHFIPYQTKTLFASHISISAISNLERVYRHLSDKDMRNYVSQDFPNTVWKIVCVTNIVAIVYRTYYILGQAIDLNDYIHRHRSIRSLVKNPLPTYITRITYALFMHLAEHWKHADVEASTTSGLYIEKVYPRMRGGLKVFLSTISLILSPASTCV